MRRLLLAVALTISPVALAESPEPPVPVKTEGLPDYLRARIEAKAREGKTALIRYLHRTRMIHGLRLEDVVKRDANDRRG